MSADDLRDCLKAGGGSTVAALSAAAIERLENNLNADAASRLFLPRLREFASLKRTPSTRRLYEETARRVALFQPDAERLTFDDMTFKWLVRFEQYLAETSPSQNARNIHLRNIRAVFNDALADDLQIPYPFKRFKIKAERTRKRALRVDDLRRLFDAEVPARLQRYLDLFKLTFMLMGINVVDLCHLKEIFDEHIEFNRAKTRRFYRMKVEPEALAIIERYRGKAWLLDVLDKNQDYRSFYRHFNHALKQIADADGVPLFPQISTYWARHSWATIAASLDIPKETIAAALGHGRDTVTDIYIDFEEEKVERANRRVLDWVLYGRR